MGKKITKRGGLRKGKNTSFSFLPIAAGAILVLAAFYFSSQPLTTQHNFTKQISPNSINLTAISLQVVPSGGYVLPFRWGKSIKTLVDAGAINVSNFTALIKNSGQQLTGSEKSIINGTYEGYIQFNSTNTEFVQLAFWALGVNNNNTIIRNGPIINASIQYSGQINSNATTGRTVTPQYVASQYFASTGGYGPIGRLQFSALGVLRLSAAQQSIADYTAENSYRPCCDNPTAFPDCNHGAAALGIIELLASQGATQNQVLRAVEEFNQYQFPGQYGEIAAYFATQGENYTSINAGAIIGKNYSSLTGYLRVHQYLIQKGIIKQAAGGAACGV
ncbi:MAG: hypothetical protein KGH53_03660 [Candidatus Micrarchaeota archaeon]|nr:hypothetical protein [Candidatus Micrarchaeota archaeon]